MIRSIFQNKQALTRHSKLIFQNFESILIVLLIFQPHLFDLFRQNLSWNLQRKSRKKSREKMRSTRHSCLKNSVFSTKSSCPTPHRGFAILFLRDWCAGKCSSDELKFTSQNSTLDPFWLYHIQTNIHRTKQIASLAFASIGISREWERDLFSAMLLTVKVWRSSTTCTILRCRRLKCCGWRKD